MIQLHVTNVKRDNLSKAKSLIKEAAGQGSKLVVLPVSGGTDIYIMCPALHTLYMVIIMHPSLFDGSIIQI